MSNARAACFTQLLGITAPEPELTPPAQEADFTLLHLFNVTANVVSSITSMLTKTLPQG